MVLRSPLSWFTTIAFVLVCGTPTPGGAQIVLTGRQPIADSLVLTDRAPTTTLTLANPSDTKRVFEIGPECPGGDYAMLGDYYKNLFHAKGMSPADPVTAAWHNAGECAAAWLSGYPRYLELAPHERRTYLFQIVPPATLPYGRYTARLYYAVHGGYHDDLEITYLHGPWPRAHWQPTPPAGPGSGVVEATPSLVELTEAASTGTFTLHNRAATPTEIWLYVDCPWFIANFANYPMSSQYEQAWHQRIPSLAFWLDGVPQHLVLAPYERRTFPFRLSPSLSSPMDGNDLYARIVYVEAPVMLDSSYTTPTGAINVVYHTPWLDATHQIRYTPMLTLSRPSIETFPLDKNNLHDAVRRACDTLHQAGIGFITTLHAEVDDARGQPISARPTASLGRGTQRSVWGLDTTVVIWNREHHSPVRIGDGDGGHDNPAIVPPAPVCFQLPQMAPGHYQLVVTAYLFFEDREHRHPVRTIFPLDVP